MDAIQKAPDRAQRKEDESFSFIRAAQPWILHTVDVNFDATRWDMQLG